MKNIIGDNEYDGKRGKKKQNNENVTSGKWDVSRVENEMCERVHVR